MRFARTFLPWGAAAMLIGFALLGVVYCQDRPVDRPPSTLLSRLKGVAFVGVTYDERNTSMALHAMTVEQHVAYIEARAKATEFNVARAAEKREVRFKLSQARTNKESREQIAKLNKELEKIDEYVERSNYQNFGSDVHRVVGVGSDYLEIEYLHRQGMTEIIPLSEIRRVIFRNDLPAFETGEVSPGKR